MKQREIIKCCPDRIKENIGEKKGRGDNKKRKSYNFKVRKSAKLERECDHVIMLHN